jgi:hypothetical protein
MAFTLAAAALFAAACDSASAQGGRRGGRGGRFGMFGGRTTHQIELASLEDVQAELKLTEDQIATVEELDDEFGDARRDLGFGGGGGGGGGFSPEAMAERAKLNAEYAAKLNESLDDAQKKRIQEIYIQVNGTATLAEEAIAMALKLTDEQKEKLNTVRDEQRQTMMDEMQALRDDGADFQEMRETIDELNKARDEALLAELTDEQKKQFEEMKGEAFEIDMSQLRGRFGGGRGGFGGGRGGRGGGDGGDGGGRPTDDAGDGA